MADDSRGRFRTQFADAAASQRAAQAAAPANREAVNVVNRRATKRPKTWCVCNRPDWGDSTYVCCDSCSQWYHPRCVGYTDQDCQKMPLFVCPWCTASGSVSVHGTSLRRSRKPLPERTPDARICICQALDDCTSLVAWCGDCEDYVHPACISLDVSTMASRTKPPFVICPPCRTNRKHLAAATDR